MITADQIRQIIADKVEADGKFIVEISVSPTNDITVVVDSPTGVAISYCEEIDALIETSFSRDVEDYSLCVSSAGIGCEFKVVGQYTKNIGNNVEVTMPNGAWVRGRLTSVDDDSFEIETEERVKVEGQKKKQTIVRTQRYMMSEVRSVKDIIEF